MPDPILLTPGPLTTSDATRMAMLRDWGSWDSAFHAITSRVCADITEIANGTGSHVCVPLQGSGTFAVEAALGTLVPRDGKVLVLDNGAYAQRAQRILEVIGRPAAALRFAEDEPIDADRLDAALSADPAITHVVLVHCETGTGILNPLERVALAVAARGRRLIVDAMSSFGALPIDLSRLPVEAVVAASGKCLEGVPGMGFVLARRDALGASAGRSHSLALDLHDQWAYLERTSQWRYTPPTHVVAALHAAIAQHRAEGGVAARGARYAANCETLVRGMRRLGFRTLLPDTLQAPIIVTFHAPGHAAWSFGDFYRHMRDRGFILYPGKLTTIDTFRIGCIGAIGPDAIDTMLYAVAASLTAMGLPDGRCKAA
jgi:2-aminoethylphosphonate-pyruvate transaminase